MLRNINDFMECTVGATDGHVGKVCDAYFDEEAWVVRYLAVDTSLLAQNRRVLIPAKVAGVPQWGEHLMFVSLSTEQISNSPHTELHSPVSRQQALACLDYYTGLGYAGARAEYQRSRALNALEDSVAGPRLRGEDDPHLRSVNEVVSYHLRAIDGDIGTISGLLIDQQAWAIRFIIVRTGHWWTGHDILIAPESIDEVFWGEASVVVALTRAAVRSSPPFDESLMVYNLGGERSYEHHDLAEHGSIAERRQ